MDIETENPVLVHNSTTLARMLSHISQQRLLALDTESNSLFAYYPRVCLIQISVPITLNDPNPLKVVDYLVDPLRLDKAQIEAIGALIDQQRLEVVMHAAENDILVLQREYRFTFHAIFDTQLAARFLNWPQVGLAALLEEQFGVVADKRMQRTNWGERPLTPQQLAYAQMDTHYLLALRQRQTQQLAELNRWEAATDAFQRLTTFDASTRTGNERSVWQLSASRDIDRQCIGILQALWEWREQEAQRLNRPPFKVVNDDVLVKIATLQPQHVGDLAAIKGLGETQCARYGSKLLRVIASSHKRPLPTPPEATLRPEQMLDRNARRRYDRLRQWRSEQALQLGLAPELIFNNQTLLEIAQREPKNANELAAVPEVSDWKIRTYGTALLHWLSQPET